MGTVTKSIGTTGRDYSSIAAWEAQLDNAVDYSAGDDAVGECYNDSDFDEDVTINGGTVIGLNSITLSVASGERHDGTAGSGARFLMSVDNRGINVAVDDVTVEWLEMDYNGNYDGSAVNSSNDATIIRHMLIHDMVRNNDTSGILLNNASTNAEVHNNIVYDIEGDDDFQEVCGIRDDSAAANYSNHFNNTVYDVLNSGNDDAFGVLVNFDSGGPARKNVRNNICMGMSSVGGSGTAMLLAGFTSEDYNLIDDTSVSNTNDLQSKVATDQFVSITGGSEDLHLKAGSDAIGAGTDLGTTDGLQIDIDGVDRDLRGSAWDMGADQAAGTVTKTIGTAARDFSTITAWEASIDTAAYQSGDDAVGECYDDSAFDENVLINGGGTTGLNSVTLTVESTQRHDGTAGTGARIDRGGAGGGAVIDIQVSLTGKVIVEWLEIANVLANSPNKGIDADLPSIVRNCLIHDIKSSTQNYQLQNGITGEDNDVEILNCIVYDIHAQGSGGSGGGIRARGIAAWSSVNVNNCTVFKTEVDGATEIAIGVYCIGSTMNIRNTISMDTTSTTSPADFDGMGAGTYLNNMSSDDTADDGGGSDHLINKVTANQFVSIVAGSEDLHLKAGSDAIDAGADLGTTDEVNVDIDGSDRTVGSRTWDMGADQRGETIVKTIGTAARDYSSISLWESDLDDPTIYIKGDVAQGECYNDSVFGGAFTINGGGTVELDGIALTAPLAERHDGTAGSGVRCVSTNNWQERSATPNNVTIEWMEFDSAGYFNSGNVISFDGTGCVIRNCLIHGLAQTIAAGAGIEWRFHSSGYTMNNVVYNISSQATGGQNVRGVRYANGSALAGECYNNTVDNIVNDNGSGDCFGIELANDAAGTKIAKNNISLRTGGTASGTIQDFKFNASAVHDYNMSSDATATGGNSLTGKSAVTNFVSIVLGSEDYHLRAGTDAFQVGVDLGTTPTNVEFDIDGLDRDTLGDPWCIGGHQLLVNVLVSAITPDNGTALGMTPVIIDGAGFQVGAVVYIDGNLASDLVFVSGIQLTAKTPSGTAGAKDVRVVNLDTSEATLSNGYTYIAVPSPVTGKTYKQNLRQTGQFNGARMLGSIGADELGSYAWFGCFETKGFQFHFLLNGLLVDDIEIAIQGCLIGGEDNPETIVTVDPTSGIDSYALPDVAYDKVRAVVTKYKAAAKNSQVTMSGRV